MIVVPFVILVIFLTIIVLPSFTCSKKQGGTVVSSAKSMNKEEPKKDKESSQSN